MAENLETATKIGFFGGTFDPPHIGHLGIAEFAIEALALDKLIFLPAGVPPHKVDKKLSSNSIREKMIQVLVDCNPAFEYSSFDLYRQGPCYTIDTLRHFRAQKEYTSANFFWLIGMDNLSQIHTWKSFEQITDFAKVVVYPRPNIEKKIPDVIYEDKLIFLDAPLLKVSSSEIRSMHANQINIEKFVLPDVYKIIKSANLYLE